MQRKLTDAYLRSLRSPATGRAEIADAACPGLSLRITVADARTWSFRFRMPGGARPERIKIGAYPSVGLADARDRANRFRADVSNGINPADSKRRERTEAPGRTFEALAHRYLGAKSGKRTIEQDRANLDRHVLPKWRHRDYRTIKRGDVVDLIEPIAKRAPIAANRVQALVSAVFSYALDSGLIEFHPSTRLKKRGIERVGYRVLSNPEIALFWHGIVHSPVTRRTGLGLRLALLTGCRAGEVAGAAKSEFKALDDPDLASWLIPGARTKSGRDHFAPLSPLARAILLELFELVPNDEQYLFPAERHVDEPIKTSTFTRAMARFGAKLTDDEPAKISWRADLPSPHDLRRTTRTRLSELGVPRDIADRVLNHAPQDVGRVHYDRHSYVPEMRNALRQLSDLISSITARGGGVGSQR